MPRTKKENTSEGMSFEDAMKRLSEISEKLEKGDAALDESLTLFEEGTALIKLCNEKLDAAEKKIKVLTKDSSQQAED